MRQGPPLYPAMTATLPGSDRQHSRDDRQTADDDCHPTWR